MERTKISELIRGHSGVYSLHDAASYSQIPYNTLRYWFIGTKKYHPVRSPVFDDNGSPRLTFRDFVEALAIRKLRSVVQLPAIRDAISECRQSHQIEYPFSDRRHIVYHDGGNLHIRLNRDGDVLQISGRQKNQQSFQELAEYFFRHITYDSDNQASEFDAGTYDEQKIVMNPRFLFGQPRAVISGCTAPTLWRAFLAEGTYEKVSIFYEVDIAAVRASVKYCQDVELVA